MCLTNNKLISAMEHPNLKTVLCQPTERRADTRLLSVGIMNVLFLLRHENDNNNTIDR
jgi:hypothetical protein